ncbi:MAG: sel1 repeat family protein [Myxococcales bacterium]|nr:sel1 repeat family protein [Myxococcales bacterium]
MRCEGTKTSRAQDEEACEAGHQVACARHGHRRILHGDPEIGAPLMEEACNRGVWDACNALAGLYGEGQRLKMDLVRARKLAERACQSPERQGCNRLAIALAKGEGGPEDPAGALALFDALCEEAPGKACVNAGRHYLKGTGTEKNVTLANGRFERACRGGEPAGCGMLGLVLLHERKVLDVSRGRDLVLRACDDGYLGACSESARMRLLGDHGATIDVEHGLRDAERACERRLPGGCEVLGCAHHLGLGLRRDPVMAEQLFRSVGRPGPENCSAQGLRPGDPVPSAEDGDDP